MPSRISVMPQPGSFSDAEAMLLPRQKRTPILVAVTWLLAGVSLSAAPLFPPGRAFIEKHCAECHDDLTKEAGLDLTALLYDPEDKANLALWIKVHDRVKAGEMPPKKKKTRPDPIAVD